MLAANSLFSVRMPFFALFEMQKDKWRKSVFIFRTRRQIPKFYISKYTLRVSAVCGVILGKWFKFPPIVLVVWEGIKQEVEVMRRQTTYVVMS